MSNVKTLQENLARDLVILEESGLDEKTLLEIEKVYEIIYNIIINVDKRKK